MKHLKTVLIMLFTTLFLSSCDVGILPTDMVGLPAAFAHCAESTSYWVWGIITTIGVGVGVWLMKKYNSFPPVILFAAAVLLLLVWVYRPSELAWNTTVEQAARGIWIGY